MTTVIADARDAVIERLKLNAGSGAQPSNAMIEGFLRAGFKRYWSLAPPVFRAAYQVSADYGVGAVDADLAGVLYVSGPRELFIPSAEFVETELGLNFRRSSGIEIGDDLVVWFVTSPTGLNTASEIETSCVFGPDWLEEAAISFAEVQSLKRMSRVHDSGGSNEESAAWVTIERELREHVQSLRETRAAWRQEMNSRLAIRLESNRLPAQPGMEAWNNESQLTNRLTSTSTSKLNPRR